MRLADRFVVAFDSVVTYRLVLTWCLNHIRAEACKGLASLKFTRALPVSTTGQPQLPFARIMALQEAGWLHLTKYVLRVETRRPSLAAKLATSGLLTMMM